MPPSSASSPAPIVRLCLSLAAAAWAVGLIAWFVLPATMELLLPLPHDGAPVLVLIVGAVAVTLVPWGIVTHVHSVWLQLAGLISANTMLLLLTGAATGMNDGMLTAVTILGLAGLHAGLVAANQSSWHFG